jgi:hypothetical protein
LKAALKFILTSVGLLLIGLNLGVVLLLTRFEGVLRDGLTHQAGQILKADVHLEAVRVDWAEQALVFKGVTVFNPEGFSDREVLKIESVWVRPSLLTVFSKTPEIREIALENAAVQLQYKPGSGTNLGAMMAHARAWGDEQAEGARWTLGRPMAIRMLRSNPVPLGVRSVDSTGPEASLSVDAFSLTDPAGDTPVSGARVIHLILRSLMKRVTQVESLEEPARELLLGEADLEVA